MPFAAYSCIKLGCLIPSSLSHHWRHLDLVYYSDSNLMADDAVGAAAGAESFDFKLYRYTPSLPAAVVFVIIFAVLSALHTWKLLRYRAYYFTAFTIGGYCKETPPDLPSEMHL